VLIIDRYQTLGDAFANLRRIAAALGDEAAQARAEAVIAEYGVRLDNLRHRLRGVTPVRVIAPSTYGVIPGAETTFQDICAEAGAENLAATLGGLTGHAMPPGEKMLKWPVEVVVLGGANAGEALELYRKLPPYAYMTAVRNRRAAMLEAWALGCVTHLRVHAYEQLARQLHPERFEEAAP
jgi:iron complex transport system substrate-binding protein